jgi:tRNA(adenine34) deaminase
MARKTSDVESRLYTPDGNIQEINYSPSKEDYDFMQIAIDEANLALSEGNPAVGAAFVTGKRTPGSVFAAHATDITDGDLLAHAEVNAYKKARNEFGRDLSSMTAYVTLDPCEMCSRLMAQGHVGKLVVAAKYDDVPEFVRKRKISLDQRLRDAGRTILVVHGVMSEEAKSLMTKDTRFH